MPNASNSAGNAIVVPALSLRTNLGKILRRIEVEQRSLIIEKRGTPAAVLLNIRDYVKLAAPEPEVLRIIGAEARRNRTGALTSSQIDRVIAKARAARKR
ncbi:MAG: type II toxin-antitoxin system Phd/YefM family antitoxin [Acidobacteriaceae bacterium]